MNFMKTSLRFLLRNRICNAYHHQGRPKDLVGGGGPKFFFFRFGNLHVAKPCALLGGFGGMPLQENFLKWCNLVRFGVYFDHILSLKNFKNFHFYIKKLKIAIFYIKE